MALGTQYHYLLHVRMVMFVSMITLSIGENDDHHSVAKNRNKVVTCVGVEPSDQLPP